MWFLGLGMVTNFASSIVNNNGNRKKTMGGEPLQGTNNCV